MQTKEHKKKYYLDNKEKINECSRQYRLDNKDYDKQYYSDNKEKIKEQQKKYQLDNKEKRKKYLLDNKEKLTVEYKQYYLDNKKVIKEKSKTCRKNQVLNLTDSYIKLQILKFKKSDNIPKEMIETKRLLIQLKREIKNN